MKAQGMKRKLGEKQALRGKMRQDTREERIQTMIISTSTVSIRRKSLATTVKRSIMCAKIALYRHCLGIWGPATRVGYLTMRADNAYLTMRDRLSPDKPQTRSDKEFGSDCPERFFFFFFFFFGNVFNHVKLLTGYAANIERERNPYLPLSLSRADVRFIQPIVDVEVESTEVDFPAYNNLHEVKVTLGIDDNRVKEITKSI